MGRHVTRFRRKGVRPRTWLLLAEEYKLTLFPRAGAGAAILPERGAGSDGGGAEKLTDQELMTSSGLWFFSHHFGVGLLSPLANRNGRTLFSPYSSASSLPASHGVPVPHLLT